MDKERLFLVASNIDDSIKSVTPVYDITVFSTFLRFEEYINETPIKLGSIIISERDLPFTSSNVARLLEVLSAPFLTLTGKCIYLISESTPKDVVTSFLEDNDIDIIMVYQGDLSSKFITDIVTGAARIADESETKIITYRMRASDYIMNQNIQKYETDEGRYITDEDELSVIPPISEPIIDVPSIDILSSVYYTVGKRSIERTLWAFLSAQYLALNGKTILVESDNEYYRLSDMVLRSGVKHKFISISEFTANPSAVIIDIRQCGDKLIVIGSKTRVHYDYDFIYDILLSNLSGWVDYFVRECDFEQTPYGSYYNIVCADTVPDILECCNSLLYEVDENKVIMIGVRMGHKTPINVTSSEMTDIVRTILEKDRLPAEVIETNGLTLRGDEVVYDVFSILARGNERQS